MFLFLLRLLYILSGFTDSHSSSPSHSSSSDCYTLTSVRDSFSADLLNPPQRENTERRQNTQDPFGLDRIETTKNYVVDEYLATKTFKSSSKTNDKNKILHTDLQTKYRTN